MSEDAPGRRTAGSMSEELTDEQLLTVRGAGAAWCGEALFDQICSELQDRRARERRLSAAVTRLLNIKAMGGAGHQDWTNAEAEVRALIAGEEG